VDGGPYTVDLPKKGGSAWHGRFPWSIKKAASGRRPPLPIWPGARAGGDSCLVVDSDPQGSLTISLGFDPDELGGHTLYEGMVLRPEHPQHHDLEPFGGQPGGVSVVPANLDLKAAELDLNAQYQREFALRRALKPLQANYEWIR